MFLPPPRVEPPRPVPLPLPEFEGAQVLDNMAEFSTISTDSSLWIGILDSREKTVLRLGSSVPVST